MQDYAEELIEIREAGEEAWGECPGAESVDAEEM